MAGKSSRTATASVRIIGGQWRRRRLPVVGEGNRPTGDRVRETLFNWLDPVIRGARVLDLYAGTGALGLEALSRSAGSAVFVEKDSVKVRHLQGLLAELGADNAEVIQTDALRYLAGSAELFDIVLLDPPFDGTPLADLCTLLNDSGWLNKGARVYLEASRQNGLPELPAGWELLREKQAGQVSYGLAAFTAA